MTSSDARDEDAAPGMSPSSATTAAGLTREVLDPGLDPIAASARWVAAERARESARADALFTDPWAEVLAGEPGRALAARMRAGDPTENPALAVRTRYFDEVLTWLLTEQQPHPDSGGGERDANGLEDNVRGGGLGQVVVLAAGMDARPYRLPLPASLLWFELDRPELLALKESALAPAGATPRCQRRPLGVDLATDWPAALRGAGFDPARPTVWLVEGLLVYLDTELVHRLLERLTALAAPGSHLLADLVGQSMLDSTWMRPWLDRLAAAGMTWRFGTDDPERLLAGHGWQITADLLSDVAAGHGRWPWPRFPRDTPGVPQSFLVHGTREAPST